MVLLHPLEGHLAVELAVVASIPLGSTIDLSTEVAGFRKVWARRRSEARIGGELVAWAHTDWVITDTRRGMPGRVPAEIQAAFGVTAGGFEPARVQLPPAPGDAVSLSLRAGSGLRLEATAPPARAVAAPRSSVERLRLITIPA